MKIQILIVVLLMLILVLSLCSMDPVCNLANFNISLESRLFLLVFVGFCLWGFMFVGFFFSV